MSDPAPSRLQKPRRRKRRQSLAVPLFFLLGGLLLFLLGFFLGRAAAAPAQSSAPAVTVPPPAEEGEGAPLSWQLILVNAHHPLPSSFTPPALTELRNGQAIDARAYEDLQQMMDDARAAGLDPLICSSYRTREQQQELYRAKVQSLLTEGLSQPQAEEQAAIWVARPDCSEHQTGLAVDIVDINYQLLDRGQEDTPVQRWLMAHCHEYGFILRYPTEKSSLTGVGYEPWHYRYVGREAARAIMARGITLEEYLEK